MPAARARETFWLSIMLGLVAAIIPKSVSHHKTPKRSQAIASLRRRRRSSDIPLRRAATPTRCAIIVTLRFEGDLVAAISFRCRLGSSKR